MMGDERESFVLEHCHCSVCSAFLAVSSDLMPHLSERFHQRVTSTRFVFLRYESSSSSISILTSHQ